jgi:2-polyprenyl-3-methyl-5-hydroxy-6-metoxy-1,4-benzoquinol methylase
MTSDSMFPDYGLFRSACGAGLRVVRPLNEKATADDPWGWNYGSGWPPSYWAFGRMRALMTMAAAVSLHPKSMLEVAAGDAALCAHLATQGCVVVANDLRKEHLEQSVLNFKNADAIRILPGNLFDLDPASIGQFDLVVACEIIEHVAHTVDFLSQLKRFVAPGGHILLTTPNGGYFRNKLPTYSMVKDFKALESQQFKPDADGHLFLITPEEMTSVARKAGLSVERMFLWGTPPVTGHVGLSVLSSRWFCGLCYFLERVAQRLPMFLKSKLAFSLSVVLKP